METEVKQEGKDSLNGESSGVVSKSPLPPGLEMVQNRHGVGILSPRSVRNKS